MSMLKIRITIVLLKAKPNSPEEIIVRTLSSNVQ